MDLAPLPNWTLDEYCRDCAGMIDIKRFDDMTVDGRNIVFYIRNRLEHDTALCVWKRREEVLSQWCVGIFVDTRSADMSFARWDQELSNCCKLRDALDAYTEVAEGDPELQCWLFEKLFTSMYFMCGGTHPTRDL